MGQYIANEKGTFTQKKAYIYDKDVPDDSLTSTFSTLILYINNERWDGVPFIISAGKALDQTVSEVRIQFKQIPGNIFKNACKKNELIIRIQPNEGIYLKMQNKRPGMDFILEETDLDLTYAEKYEVKLKKNFKKLKFSIIFRVSIYQKLTKDC